MADRMGMSRLRMKLRQRRQRDRADRGFTLVEMLVTMALFGMVMSVVVAALANTERFASKVQDSADAISQLRQSIDVIDRQVRSGNVLFSPADETTPSTCTASGVSGGTCMRIYTQSNGINRCVQWQVLGQGTTATLRSRSWSPSWQTDGSYTTWKTEASGLKVTSQAPFSLLNSSGTQTTGAANATTGRYLYLAFTAIDPRYANKTVSITSSVSGRNTNYGFNAGVCSPAPPETAP